MKWNAAARRVLELCDRGVAGNREMVRELTSPQLIRIDNRHGVAAPPADQDAWIRTFLDMIEVIGPEQRMTLIAQRGDRLALHHGRTKSHAGFELDFLFLVRLDEHSRFDHFENFDAQELPAAVARLDELYLQGEAAAHADILRPLSVLVAASGSRDVSGWEATLAEDSLVVDHRMSVRQEFDRDAWLETVRAQGQVAGAGVAWIPYFERLVDEGGIGPIVQRSTSPEGIEAEWVSIGMSLLDDGRITRMEILEDDGLAQAAARFDELMGDRDVSAETSGRFLENRSTRTIQRWQALWEALDWDGFEAHLSPDIEFLARHTGPKTGGELSRDALIGTMRAMVDVGYVATDRERERERDDRHPRRPVVAAQRPLDHRRRPGQRAPDHR